MDPVHELLFDLMLFNRIAKPMKVLRPPKKIELGRNKMAVSFSWAVLDRVLDCAEHIVTYVKISSWRVGEPNQSMKRLHGEFLNLSDKKGWGGPHPAFFANLAACGRLNSGPSGLRFAKQIVTLTILIPTRRPTDPLKSTLYARNF